MFHLRYGREQENTVPMTKSERLQIILDQLPNLVPSKNARETCEKLINLFFEHEHFYEDPIFVRPLAQMILVKDETVYVALYKQHILSIHQDGSFEIRKPKRIQSPDFYSRNYTVIRQYPLIYEKQSLHGKHVWDYRKN